MVRPFFTTNIHYFAIDPNVAPPVYHVTATKADNHLPEGKRREGRVDVVLRSGGYEASAQHERRRLWLALHMKSGAGRLSANQWAKLRATAYRNEQQILHKMRKPFCSRHPSYASDGKYFHPCVSVKTNTFGI